MLPWQVTTQLYNTWTFSLYHSPFPSIFPFSLSLMFLTLWFLPTTTYLLSYLPFYGLSLDSNYYLSIFFLHGPHFYPDILVNWSILKILLKLAPDARWYLVVNFLKALITFGDCFKYWLFPFQLSLTLSVLLGRAQPNNNGPLPGTDPMSIQL